jgi:hypothetical protein
MMNGVLVHASPAWMNFENVVLSERLHIGLRMFACHVQSPGFHPSTTNQKQANK